MDKIELNVCSPNVIYSNNYIDSIYDYSTTYVEKDNGIWNVS